MSRRHRHCNDQVAWLLATQFTEVVSTHWGQVKDEKNNVWCYGIFFILAAVLDETKTETAMAQWTPTVIGKYDALMALLFRLSELIDHPQQRWWRQNIWMNENDCGCAGLGIFLTPVHPLFRNRNDGKLIRIRKWSSGNLFIFPQNEKRDVDAGEGEPAKCAKIFWYWWWKGQGEIGRAAGEGLKSAAFKCFIFLHITNNSTVKLWSNGSQPFWVIPWIPPDSNVCVPLI